MTCMLIWICLDELEIKNYIFKAFKNFILILTNRRRKLLGFYYVSTLYMFRTCFLIKFMTKHQVKRLWIFVIEIDLISVSNRRYAKLNWGMSSHFARELLFLFCISFLFNVCHCISYYANRQPIFYHTDIGYYMLFLSLYLFLLMMLATGRNLILESLLFQVSVRVRDKADHSVKSIESLLKHFEEEIAAFHQAFVLV